MPLLLLGVQEGAALGTPPVNTVAPAISGTTAVGSVLTTTTGTWTGTPTITYAYQWLRGGSAISGATSSSYTLVSGDTGAMLSVTVTATNTAGNASATATAVGPVTGGGTSVSVNAVGSVKALAGTVTSFSYNNITVAAGTNSALIATIVLDTSTPVTSGVSAVWDSGGTNQTMTLLSRQDAGVNGGTALIFGLRAPTTGNKTLAVSWTTATGGYYASAIAFDHVSQTSDATAFPSAGRVTGLGPPGANTTSSITIPSAAVDYCVSASTLVGGVHRTAQSDTELFYSTAASADNGEAQYGVGASSKTMTVSLDSTGGWATVGVDVAAG